MRGNCLPGLGKTYLQHGEDVVSGEKVAPYNGWGEGAKTEFVRIAIRIITRAKLF